MKKILAIILALMMALSLCACGNEPSDEPANDPVSESAEESSQPEEPAEEPEEQPEEEPEVEAKRGKIENGVYTNEVFGITFSGGDEWYFYNDEEIAATYGIAVEQMLTEEYAQVIEEASLIYDMYAVNVNTGATVNVNYENLGLVYGSVFDEKAYLEIAKTQLETQLSASGISLSKNEVSAVSIGGEEFPCLEVAMDYNGTVIYEIIVCKKVGQWMGSFTIGSVNEGEPLEIVQKLSLE